MTNSVLRPIEEVVTERFGDIPADQRFATIQAMAQDDKMRLLAGLVSLTIDGTVARGTSPTTHHATLEDYARAAELDVGKWWEPSVGFFDRMKKSALLDLLPASGAKECASKKKGELAAMMADRLPSDWLPDPLAIGAFDKQKDDVPAQHDDEGEMSEAA